MQQSHSLDFKLVQRVCLLQQALDQALDSLDELTAQVQDKYWVETQLASTEKYANVQQQAINHLKRQLAQFTEIQDHLLGVMGFRLNELIDQQQQGFDQLNLQFQQSHTEVQTYLQYLTQQQTDSGVKQGSSAYYRSLEEEVMVARSMAVHLSQYLGLAKQHLDHLNADLGNHHLNLSQIIQTIQAMIAELAKFDQPAAKRATPIPPAHPVIVEAVEEQPSAALEPPETTDVEALQATIRRQAARIEELKGTLDAHVAQETRLRQQCQIVGAERDYYYRRLQQQSPLETSINAERSQVLPTPRSPQPETDAQRPVIPPRRPRSRPSQPIQPLRLPEEG